MHMSAVALGAAVWASLERKPPFIVTMLLIVVIIAFVGFIEVPH